MCKFGKEVMGCRKKLRQDRYKKYLFFILDPTKPNQAKAL